MWVDYRDGKNKEYRDGNHYIPSRMMGAIIRYIEDGILPGDFLCAVISGNLFKAVAYADSENLDNLAAYCKFFYNHAPAGCWGTEKHMYAWAKRKGFNKGEKFDVNL